MMKKKLIILLLSILCLFGIYFGISYVKADSGWDSDYDSDWGSDWDSDYDSDWGSDWDSDYSWSYDSDTGTYHGSINGEDFLLIIMFIIIIVFIIEMSLTNKKNKSSSLNTNNYISEYEEVSQDILNKYGIDAEKFKTMVYEKYVNIQNAWSNFEYDKLRNLLTDELYNSYVMQLDALKLKNQKNIMSDFICIDCKITNVNDENGLINVAVYLRIQMFDYVVDKDNKVVRGTDKNKIDIQYIIKFVKVKDNKEIICPNCGAKINVVTGGQCEYCRTTVLIDPNEFVMSSKTNVGQRRI